MKFPEEYAWSSYRSTAGLDAVPRFLHIKDLLIGFGPRRNIAQQKYQSFVLDGIGEDSPLKEPGRGRVLGSPQFVSQTWNRFDDFFKERPENAKEEKMLGRPSLSDIFEGKMTLADRNEAISFAVNICGYSNASVARLLHLSPASVSMIIKRKTEH